MFFVDSLFIQNVLEKFSLRVVENSVESVENPFAKPVFHNLEASFPLAVENLST